MSYEGDIRLGDTIDIKFSTRSFTTGAPTTLAGTPVISAYPGNSTTQLTAGITLSVDFDSVTGLHNVRIVATSGNGYATATDYTLVITTGTVGGVSVVGEVVGSFSIEHRSALMPTTAARTLDVSAGGEAGIDWANIGTPLSIVSLSFTTLGVVNSVAANGITASSIAADAIGASEIASDAVTKIRALVTGTSDSGTTTTMVDAARGETDTDLWKGCWILFTSGNIQNEVRLITGFDPATDTITFVPATTQAVSTQDYAILPAAGSDVWLWKGGLVLSPTFTGVPKVDVVDVDGAALTAHAAGKLPADVLTVAGTAQTAGDLKASLNTVQSDTDDIQTRLPAALVGGRMDSSVGAMAVNVVTATAIAADAIGASELAADAVTEIQSGLATSAVVAAIKAKTDNLPSNIPKNAPLSNFQFIMVSSVDHVTPLAGLGSGILGFRTRDGNATESIDNVPTEVSSGLYRVNLTAADLNADVVTLGFRATGADDRFITILTRP